MKNWKCIIILLINSYNPSLYTVWYRKKYTTTFMMHFASKVSTFSAISTRTFFMKYIVVCTTTIVHSSYNRYYETAKHFFLSKVRVEKRVFVKIKHLFSFGSLYKFPALGKTSWFMHELLSRKKLSYKNTTTKTFHKNILGSIWKPRRDSVSAPVVNLRICSNVTVTSSPSSPHFLLPAIKRW